MATAGADAAINFSIARGRNNSGEQDHIAIRLNATMILLDKSQLAKNSVVITHEATIPYINIER